MRAAFSVYTFGYHAGDKNFWCFFFGREIFGCVSGHEMAFLGNKSKTPYFPLKPTFPKRPAARNHESRKIFVTAGGSTKAGINVRPLSHFWALLGSFWSPFEHHFPFCGPPAFASLHAIANWDRHLMSLLLQKARPWFMPLPVTGCRRVHRALLQAVGSPVYRLCLCACVQHRCTGETGQLLFRSWPFV